MAKTKVSEFDATASNNTDINSVNVAEGCPPSGINNAIREMASLLKKQEVGTDPMTSPDINGGTIDGATIGASSASTGAFTNLSASGTFTSRGIDDNADATAITIDSSENVGIGTASPAYILDIQGQNAGSDAILRLKTLGTQTYSDAYIYLETAGSGITGIQFGDSADSNAGLINYDHSNNSLYIRTNATERMRIDSAGNVGIGTSSPLNTLQIGSSFPITINGNYPDIHFNGYYASPSYRAVTTGYSAKMSFNAGTGSFAFSSGSSSTSAGSDYSPTQRMIINKSGNVGIGTSSNLLGSLTVFNGDNFSTANNNSNDNIYLISDATSGDGVYGASIAFSRVQYPDRKGAAIASVQTGSDEDNVGLAFFTHPSATATDPLVEAMRIDSSGNVGINKSSPTSGYMLHVGGSSGVHTKVKIEATTATGQAELDLSADPAGVSYLNLGDEDSHNIGYLGYFHSDNSMRFQTNSAEQIGRASCRERV